MMLRNFLLLIQVLAILHHDRKEILVVVIKPYMLRECELMCKLVSNKENIRSLVQYATSTKLDADGGVLYVAPSYIR